MKYSPGPPVRQYPGVFVLSSKLEEQPTCLNAHHDGGSSGRRPARVILCQVKRRCPAICWPFKWRILSSVAQPAPSSTQHEHPKQSSGLPQQWWNPLPSVHEMSRLPGHTIYLCQKPSVSPGSWVATGRGVLRI